MFTKNGYLAVAYWAGFPNTGVTTFYNNIVKCNGEKVTARGGTADRGGLCFSTSYFMKSLMTIANKQPIENIAYERSGSSPTPPSGVFFSNGTEADKESDYAPAGSKFFTTFTSSYSASDVFEDGYVEKTTLFTLTNTGTEDFTIGEVGLIDYIYCTNSSSSSTKYYNSFLLDRVFLETPITISANGGVGQVAYTIRLPLAAS